MHECNGNRSRLLLLISPLTLSYLGQQALDMLPLLPCTTALVRLVFRFPGDYRVRNSALTVVYI